MSKRNKPTIQSVKFEWRERGFAEFATYSDGKTYTTTHNGVGLALKMTQLAEQHRTLGRTVETPSN